MIHQTSYYRSLILNWIILVSVFMQISCSNETENVSYGEFVNSLKGEWSVVEFTFGYFYGQVDSLNIIRVGDNLKYCINENMTETYSTDDPNLCALPGMEFMQHWTITETTNELILEIENLCGIIESYKMVISNLHHLQKNDLFGQDRYSINMEADLDLVASDSTISLLEHRVNDFRIIITWEPDRMYFGMDDYSHYYYFSLDRR